jgi:cyclic pyranopterin monophosphate synthase
MTASRPGEGGGFGSFGDATRADRRRGGRVERMGRPHMADLTQRPVVARRAVAEAEVVVSQETLSAAVDGTNPKGDVLSVCELAGVMAAKRTAELIPLVHATPLTELLVNATPDRAASAIRIRAEAATVGPVDVEMEAMTAAATAALAAYDMVRDVDPAAEIRNVHLVSSTGEEEPWQRPYGQDAGHAPRGARMAGRAVMRNPGSPRPTSHKRP